MWFNPGDLLAPLANSATSATPEGKSSKVAEVAETNNLTVTCYTPNGNPVEVVARDRDHAGQLRRWNP